MTTRSVNASRFSEHGTDNVDDLKRCVLFTKPLNILKTIPPKRLVRNRL